MLSNSQLRGTESQQLSYLFTRTTPTATQTRPFANANPTIMPTAGNGSFRRPGIRAWQAIARLFMLFFRWWRGIVPFNVVVGPMPVEVFTHVKAKRFQSDNILSEPCPLLHMAGNVMWLRREVWDLLLRPRQIMSSFPTYTVLK